MPLFYEWLKRAVKDSGSAGRAALVYRDTYLSWRGLLHRVDRRAQELASYGIGEGSWLGLMLGNVPDFVVLALAASKLRAVLCPIDPTTGARDLDMLLEAAPLRALVTRPQGQGSAGESSPSVPAPPVRPDGRPYQPRFVPEARRRLQGTLLNCNLFRREPMAFAPGVEPSVVLVTTDVGGDPRGIVRGPRELEAIAASIAGTLELDGSEQTLALSPLHRAYGFDFGLLSPLARGSTLFLDDEMEARRISKGLRDQSIDVFPATPAIYAALARVVTARALEPRRPRFLSSGSPLPAAVAEAWTARYKVPVLSCYHTTETGPLAIDRAGEAPTTVGTPFDGVELRLDGGGAGGGIWVRTAGAARSSVPEPRVAAKGVLIGRFDDEGWLRTGDRGRLARGVLTLDGREDDIVKVEGRKVALGEVEGCLESFAKVRAAEARLVADDAGGATVIARVVSAGACKAEELIDHCARHLAPYKVPRQIEFCERLG